MMKIRVYPVELFGLLLLVLFAVGSPATAAPGRVAGEIEPADSVPCRGMVSLWPADGGAVPDPRTSDAIPPWVNELNADCSFSLDADPGNYFLRVTLRRSPGPDLGPTRKGDLIFLSPDVQGGAFPVNIQSGQPINVGSQAGGWEFTGSSEPIETGIVGMVTNEQGVPMAGLLVHAFSERGLNKPPFAVSAATDSAGHFQLRFTQGGVYYLQARERIGFGMLPVGSITGTYGSGSAAAVTVKKGRLVSEILIKVAPVPAEK